MDTTPVKPVGKVSEPPLLLVAKSQLGVLGKRSSVDGVIGGIKVDEVTTHRFDGVELSKFNSSFLKRNAALFDIVLWDDIRFVIAAYRNIKLALLVDSVKPVIACLIEIDESRRNVNWFLQVVLAADTIIIGLAVPFGVAFQLSDQGFRVKFDHVIS